MQSNVLVNLPQNYNFHNLTGETFGRLTVLEYLGNNKHRQPLWRCRCSCGNETIVSTPLLRRGATTSCGCYQKERTSQLHRTHGFSGTRLYGVWKAMVMRCHNRNCRGFKDYGAKGIRVAEEWRTFAGFLKDMGAGYQPGLTLDRIDNSKGYGPGNCRWVSMKVQNNNRSNNRRLAYRGETMTMSEAAERYGIPRDTLKARLRNGWTIERALTEPVARRVVDAGSQAS